jgi:hypothetical protein
MRSAHDHEAVGAVAERMRQNGFQVRRVPEMQIETPDLIAEDKRDYFLIEVKRRIGRTEDGPAIESNGYRSSINSFVEKGVKQLSKLRAEPKAYRVLWIIIPEDDEEEFILNNIINTLYGVQQIEMSRGGMTVEGDCFFFNHCSMRKFQHLACVVIDTPKGLVFCINRSFARTEQFKRTRMYALQKRRDGVIDEKFLQNEKCCFIADDCTPGKELRLLNKYGFTSLRRVTRKRYSDSRTVRLDAAWLKKSPIATV